MSETHAHADEVLVPPSDDEQTDDPAQQILVNQTASSEVQNEVVKNKGSGKVKGPGKGKAAKDPGKRRRKFDNKAGRYATMQQATELNATEKTDDGVKEGENVRKKVVKKKVKVEEVEEDENWKPDIPWIHPDNRSRAAGLGGALADQTWFEVRKVDGVADSIPAESTVFGTNAERGGCMRCQMKGIVCDLGSPCKACVQDMRPEGCFPDVPRVLPNDNEERSASRQYALAFASYEKHVEKKNSQPAKPKMLPDFFKPVDKKKKQ
ncbi:hypothetical protein I302_103854 [Kwoniella bestiolae CBS 10118]|uniref:Zn(2)-C6 fungal-type domain-containing protein n=1 Tax=Kwoniella bestiolae CBS 10118 TaxID=1296100 RepID=A0A1B9G9J7_9TREE|nr:hypothetical protein I302_02557 [Kwoniella bestiolae CBS 10118]OCF27712.1 hypothetical protein I302_02557 [Kwoniella bestiolae CBS 10118]